MQRYRAVTKFVRISPTKARLAAGLIRGKSASEAEDQLRYAGSKGGRLLEKTLKSAIANAESRSDIPKEELVVDEVRVDDGPRMKRSKPRSKGSRHPFLKRMSHFTVVVAAKQGA